MTTVGYGNASEATECPRKAQGHENKKHFYNSTSLGSYLDFRTTPGLTWNSSNHSLLSPPCVLSGKLLNLHVLCFFGGTVGVFVRSERRGLCFPCPRRLTINIPLSIK